MIIRTSRISAASFMLPLLLAMAGCQQPVSTDNLAAQENAMQVEGQAAMNSEGGTTGNASTAELGATQTEGINFADPDPFIDYDTVRQEKGIEGDETD
ncbi:MAG: hypothetical protein CMJ36_05940 [Phycisphaerae bacterium]|nr:hypothetical protein [Phycisphaerae bacterium]